MTARAPEPVPLRPAPGRVPPHDLDAEAAVISAVMLEPASLPQVTGIGLAAMHFYSDRNRLVWQAIVDQEATGDPVDVITVAVRLRNEGSMERVGGSGYLAVLTDATPAVSNVETHARAVVDCARRRHMISELQTRAAEGYSHVDDVGAWLTDVEASVADIARSRADTHGPLLIGASGEPLLDRLQRASKGDVGGVPTGFTLVDRKIGGLSGSKLYVVAARPGMGKTAFGLDVAVAVASPPKTPQEPTSAPHGVVFFSIEMAAEELALRALCSDQRLDSHRLTRGLAAPGDWDRIAQGILNLRNLALWVDDSAQLTLAELRSRTRKLRADIDRGRGGIECSGLSLVVVDYLQLLFAERRPGQSREEVVSDQAKGLKALSKELEVPVLALAQLNRSCEQRPNKRPILSDLRESGAIEQEADAVAFLYRDEVYHKDSADAGIAELIVGKQRAGPLGTVKLRYTPAYTRFDNLAENDYDFDDFDDFE